MLIDLHGGNIRRWQIQAMESWVWPVVPVGGMVPLLHRWSAPIAKVDLPGQTSPIACSDPGNLGNPSFRLGGM